MQMAPERPARRAIEWTPADGRRKRGRPVASFQPNIGGSDTSYTSYSTTSPSSLL